jgi:hypothetical protein
MIGYFSGNSQPKSEMKDSLMSPGAVAPEAANSKARAHAEEEALEYLTLALMFMRQFDVTMLHVQ